jgi:hypothetical protein
MINLSKSLFNYDSAVEEWSADSKQFHKEEIKIKSAKSFAISKIVKYIEDTEGFSPKAKHLFSGKLADYDPRFRSGDEPGMVNTSILDIVVRHLLEANPRGLEKAFFPPLAISIWLESGEYSNFKNECFTIPELGIDAFVVGVQKSARSESHEIVHVVFIESALVKVEN